jgi:hypothetical protein
MTASIAVRTVGLRSYQQAQLKAQLGVYPRIELKHLDKWSFRVLNADVLIIGVDSRGGQEAMGVMSYFFAKKEPLVVTYSENDERMLLLTGGGSQAGDGDSGGRQPAGFYQRLQDVLHKAGATDVSFDDVGGPEVELPSVEGPKAEGGIRWKG